MLGVTRVLRLAGVAPEVPDTVETAVALERGREVHEAMEAIDRGEPVREDVRRMHGGYLAAYESFLAMVGARWQVLGAEVAFEDLEAGYRGRIDRVVLFDGRLTVADLKTGDVPAWVGVQLAGYAQAIRRTMFPTEAVPARVSVALRRDGTFRLRRCEDVSDHDRWRAALDRAQDSLICG